ncbi:hypothetical protein DKX38_012971 [Salix brachista]|uniref:Uncharacterized protein n=1 Tax=Salix brachista TaxID=2182728 RepID=A0A5N5LQ40_9ROSI|nr:hypothetical protein DKX38_012971 [Salix brachista]
MNEIAKHPCKCCLCYLAKEQRWSCDNLESCVHMLSKQEMKSCRQSCQMTWNLEVPFHILYDGILVQITSKANGKLRTLPRLNCFEITGYRLQTVVEKNPSISKVSFVFSSTMAASQSSKNE